MTVTKAWQDFVERRLKRHSAMTADAIGHALAKQHHAHGQELAHLRQDHTALLMRLIQLEGRDRETSSTVVDMRGALARGRRAAA